MLSVKEALVFAALAIHPILAIEGLVRVLFKLRSKNVLRFDLGAAVSLTIIFGAMLGGLVFFARWLEIHLLGTPLLVLPLPLWILGGVGREALRLDVSVISRRETVVGAAIGFTVYVWLVGAQIGICWLSGVH